VISHSLAWCLPQNELATSITVASTSIHVSIIAALVEKESKSKALELLGSDTMTVGVPIPKLSFTPDFNALTSHEKSISSSLNFNLFINETS
jgi:hypothetical protein